MSIRFSPKKCLIGLFIVLFALSPIMAQSGAPTKLVVACRTFGTSPTDLKVVEEEINKITRSKINAEIQLLVIASGSYRQQMTLMLSGNEQLDCMGALAAIFSSAYNNDQLLPLDSLLKQYGSGITSVVDPKYLTVGRFDGKQYGITTNRDQARGYGGFVLRSDILKKYNIDVKNVDSFEKLSKVFAIVHEKEPQMVVVAPGSVGASPLQWNVDFDNLGDYFGVLLNHGAQLKVENLFSSEQYKNYLKVMRDWYLKGYFSKDVVNATEAGSVLSKAGNLFAYCYAGKPGVIQEQESASGQKLTYVQVLPTFTSTAAPLTWQWTIPRNSKNPEKAMQFLNLMYTDPAIMNLISYGIEGKHYVMTSDGTIDYPKGVNAKTSGYSLNMTWQFGNEFIAKVWKGADPALWQDTIEWNKTGKTSKAMGFLYNNSDVANEVAAVQNAYNEFRMGLECGVLDYNEALPKMLKKLDAAGLQQIMALKQSQLDAWAKANGIK